MGRVALGAAAKDKVIAARVTNTEKAVLEARHGNLGRWLRRLIDEELQKELNK